MTHHMRGTSEAFAEKVFMSEKRARKLRVLQPYVNLLRSWMPDKNTSWRLAQLPYNCISFESHAVASQTLPAVKRHLYNGHFS